MEYIYNLQFINSLFLDNLNKHKQNIITNCKFLVVSNELPLFFRIFFAMKNLTLWAELLLLDDPTKFFFKSMP